MRRGKNMEEAQPDIDPSRLVWMNTAEAAIYLRVTPQALRNRVYQGTVPHYKFQRSLRFKRSELDRMLEATRIGGLAEESHGRRQRHF